MSEVRIVYSSLEDAVDYASKARTKIDNYITQIGKTINAPISNLNGSDSYGYAPVSYTHLTLPTKLEV